MGGWLSDERRSTVITMAEKSRWQGIICFVVYSGFYMENWLTYSSVH